MLNVTEIFYSVQGEGPRSGAPSVFLRLSGCNLTCSWCDTKYSWGGGKSMTVQEVKDEIWKYPCNFLTITGGEPILQQDELINLIQNIRGGYGPFHVEIETNGTIAPKPELVGLVNEFIVSPKFEDFKYNSAWSNTDKVAFKFVVDKEEDFAVIERFIQKYAQNGQDIFLMPQAITVDEHNKRLPMLIEFVKKHRLRVMRISPRLQILAYGNKRGV